MCMETGRSVNLVTVCLLVTVELYRDHGRGHRGLTALCFKEPPSPSAADSGDRSLAW